MSEREIAHWDERWHGPYCRTCGCGGDWHYEDCEVGRARGDTIVIAKEIRTAPIPAQEALR